MATAKKHTETAVRDQYRYTIDQWNADGSHTFEMPIPQNAIKSYRGKNSNLYWSVGTKVDVAMSSDLRTGSTIEIEF